MVKSDNPRAILNKHKKDYLRMSNIKKSWEPKKEFVDKSGKVYVTAEEDVSPFIEAPDGEISRGGKKK